MHDLDLAPAPGHSADPPPPAPPVPDPPPELLRAVSRLLESRLRWHDLALLAADFAWETDAAGRFTFVAPEQALGWPAARLLGTDAARLLAESGPGTGMNPFQTATPLRGLRTWLRRGDGGVACVTLAAAPVLGPDGRQSGARGLAIDMSDTVRQEEATLASLRRLEALEHILTRLHEEILAPRMMETVLGTLHGALGSEGLAVIDGGGKRDIAHSHGQGTEHVLETARALFSSGTGDLALRSTPDGRPVMLVSTCTRFGEVAGLAAWRPPGGREWDEDEQRLLFSTTAILRVVLEHGAIQSEMLSQARTDPLTGLFNRRAFLEELPRRLERLEQDGRTGSLLYVDVDHLKKMNDRWGHEAGDQVILQAARRLRAATRSTDLVARLGGDEFAIWLDGADLFTAAERADRLCNQVAADEVETPEGPVPLSLSIGVAARPPGVLEDLEGLLHRADQAMYVVKTTRRGRWHAAASPT